MVFVEVLGLPKFFISTKTEILVNKNIICCFFMGWVKIHLWFSIFFWLNQFSKLKCRWCSKFDVIPSPNNGRPKTLNLVGVYGCLSTGRSIWVFSLQEFLEWLWVCFLFSQDKAYVEISVFLSFEREFCCRFYLYG